MAKVQLSAQLLKVESKSDRTYKLTFNTQELQGDEASKLLTLLMNQGWLLFSPEALTEVDIPGEKPSSMTGGKTQAQRLRGALYVLWEQGGKSGEFEQYYRLVMERYIDQIKEKLE
jgi:hypothetical protein